MGTRVPVVSVSIATPPLKDKMMLAGASFDTFPWLQISFKVQICHVVLHDNNEEMACVSHS